MIDLMIHKVDVGVCALTGKEGEGLQVTFKDGTLKEGFLSQKAFFQLLKMKLAQGQKVETKSEPRPEVKAAVAVPAVPVANGPVKPS